MDCLQRPAFASTTKGVLICLTTLRHRRFVEDAINIVGIPHGGRLRLRYRKQYVSPDVWKQATENQTAVQELLIALGGGNSDGRNDVVPLRTATIKEVSCRGELLILDVALGDFAFEATPSGGFWEELRTFNRGLPQHFRPDQSAPGHYIAFLQPVTTRVLRSPAIHAWEKVARRVFELDDLSIAKGSAHCVPFLYFLDGLGARVQNRLATQGAIIIEAGGRLSMDVHSITRSGLGMLRNALGEVLLEVSHPSAVFSTSRRLRVDSSRDVKRVALSTSALFRKSHGHLSVRLIEFRNRPKDGNPTSSPQTQPADWRDSLVLARYDAPLIVGRWRPIVASAALAASTAFIAYDSRGSVIGMDLNLLICAAVFVLAFGALSLGFWKDKSGA